MTAYPTPTHARHPDDAGRPGLIRTLAAIGMILAVLGLLTAPYTGLRLVGSSADSDMEQNHPTAKWMVVTTLGSMGLSVLLLIASTGCLKLRRWGRLAMLAYAVGALLLGVGGAYVYLHWAGAFGPPPAAQRGVVAFIQLIGWVLSTLYAAWALFVLTRPHAREAFGSVRPREKLLNTDGPA